MELLLYYELSSKQQSDHTLKNKVMTADSYLIITVQVKSRVNSREEIYNVDISYQHKP